MVLTAHRKRQRVFALWLNYGYWEREIILRLNLNIITVFVQEKVTGPVDYKQEKSAMWQEQRLAESEREDAIPLTLKTDGHREPRNVALHTGKGKT